MHKFLERWLQSKIKGGQDNIEFQALFEETNTKALHSVVDLSADQLQSLGYNMKSRLRSFKNQYSWPSQMY